MGKEVDNRFSDMSEPVKKRPTSQPSKKQKRVDPAVKRRQELKSQNKALIKAAVDLVKRMGARALFVYADCVDLSLLSEKLLPETHVVLVTKDPAFNDAGRLNIKDVVTIPRLRLGRMGIIKVALVLALSAKVVDSNDKVVFLVGKTGTNCLDTMLCIRIGEESELLTGHSLAEIPATIVPAVFEHTLNFAIELGSQGKEGKPVGTIFVLGDEEKVMQLSKQMIINPFKGYDPEERNILNPALKETMRELSSVDGAFVIAGNGEVVSAGRYLGAATEQADIPRGLGSRHVAASGITALTNAVAIVISESTGDVRIFRNGKIIMAIEKPTHK